MAVGDKVHFPFTEATVDSGTYIYGGIMNFVFSADLQGGDTVAFDVNGNAISVPFNTDNATTLADIVTALLAFTSLISAAEVTGNNQITVTPIKSLVINNISITTATTTMTVFNKAMQNVCIPLIWVKIIP